MCHLNSWLLYSKTHTCISSLLILDLSAWKTSYLALYLKKQNKTKNFSCSLSGLCICRYFSLLSLPLHMSKFYFINRGTNFILWGFSSCSSVSLSSFFSLCSNLLGINLEICSIQIALWGQEIHVIFFSLQKVYSLTWKKQACWKPNCFNIFSSPIAFIQRLYFFSQPNSELMGSVSRLFLDFEISNSCVFGV